MTAALKRCTSGAPIFRLVKHIQDHFPPDARKPLPAAFSLTNADELEAKRRGIPPLLSVWDRAKTSVGQARAIRAADARKAGRAAEGVYSPFFWTVATIEAIEAPGGRLFVYEDPRPQADGPGAPGHTGIAGLHVPKGDKAATRVAKALRVKLVDACEPLPEEAPRSRIASVGLWVGVAVLLLAGALLACRLVGCG